MLHHDPIAVEVAVDETWCYVVCVMEDCIAYACLKRAQREGVHAVLTSRGDILQFLEGAVPLGHRVKRVPLSDLQTIEWHEDDANMVFRHFDQTRHKQIRTSATLLEKSARIRIVEAAKLQAQVPFTETDAKPSIWHVGTTQIILSVFMTILLVVPAIIHIVNPNEPELSTKGRHAGIKSLINAIIRELGPMGALLLGLGIIAALMLWWCWAYKFPPKKTIATAVRT